MDVDVAQEEPRGAKRAQPEEMAPSSSSSSSSAAAIVGQTEPPVGIPLHLLKNQPLAIFGVEDLFALEKPPLGSG